MLRKPGQSDPNGRGRAQSSNRRKTQDGPDDIIRKLQRMLGNKKCADCGAKLPGAVNLTHGTFVCSACSGVHREFSHRVKGVGHSSFTKEEAEYMSNHGNDAVNEVYLANFQQVNERLRAPDGSSSTPDGQLLRVWIRMKYHDKKWTSTSSNVGSSNSVASAQTATRRTNVSSNSNAYQSQPTKVSIPPKKKKSKPKPAAAPPAADLLGGAFIDPAPVPAPKAADDGWDAFSGSKNTQATFQADFGSNTQQQQQPAFQASFDQTQQSQTQPNVTPQPPQQNPAFNSNFASFQQQSQSQQANQPSFDANFQNMQQATPPQQQMQPGFNANFQNMQQQAPQPGFNANFQNVQQPSPQLQPQQQPSQQTGFNTNFQNVQQPTPQQPQPTTVQQPSTQQQPGFTASFQNVQQLPSQQQPLQQQQPKPQASQPGFNANFQNMQQATGQQPTSQQPQPSVQESSPQLQPGFDANFQNMQLQPSPQQQPQPSPPQQPECDANFQNMQQPAMQQTQPGFNANFPHVQQQSGFNTNFQNMQQQPSSQPPMLPPQQPPQTQAQQQSQLSYPPQVPNTNPTKQSQQHPQESINSNVQEQQLVLPDPPQMQPPLAPPQPPPAPQQTEQSEVVESNEMPGPIPPQQDVTDDTHEISVQNVQNGTVAAPTVNQSHDQNNGPESNADSAGAMDAFSAFDGLGLGPTDSIGNAIDAEHNSEEKKENNETKNVSPQKYSVGQVVKYKDSSNNVTSVEILKVHLDDDLIPFYDIKMPDGREKQTDDLHLFLDDPDSIERKDITTSSSDTNLTSSPPNTFAKIDEITSTLKLLNEMQLEEVHQFVHSILKRKENVTTSQANTNDMQNQVSIQQSQMQTNAGSIMQPNLQPQNNVQQFYQNGAQPSYTLNQ